MNQARFPRPSTSRDASEVGRRRFLRIADVVALTCVNASTLRLWERHGILIPNRRDNNYRVYTDADLVRIKDIKRLRETEGLSLNLIRSALLRSSGFDGGLPTQPSMSKNGRGNNHNPLNANEANNAIGWKLKALRRRLKLSLREVATRTGLTASHISVFERTSSGASPATLSKLAKCYQTTMNDLNRVAQTSEDVQIIRGHGRALPAYMAGVKIEQLAEGPLKMEAMRFCLEPGASSGLEPYSHEGEEFIYVVKGRFEITFDGVMKTLLKVGDSVYFSSTRLHSWRNPGTGPSELIWINAVP